ncbi:hypothetical protein AKJ52_00850 [candidate division MSBL1 archaeon SCGC-AAA382C18]|uniref:Uncharacterized protein n=1 Tax=candidate division MSBL1 archaeon SCGC-AAA382C18 TaxID=1698281 RepID=A0A133VKZ9_9EURY|nr:hypothetical protein AKJ52_00850 [candidate division MSBL1 archaeon SCGC-AAA382C18]
MPVPSEIAWIVPLILPFVIGLIIGLIVKKTINLILLAVVLVAILSTTGYLGLTVNDLYDKSMKYLPKLTGSKSKVADMLPISTPAFLIGLALGLWKG